MMRVWKFGDNIDTDAIIPGRFLTINDPKGLSEHAFEGFRDGFAKEVKEGDMIVAGRNFGCGSSREHAPLALNGSGVLIGNDNSTGVQYGSTRFLAIPPGTKTRSASFKWRTADSVSNSGSPGPSPTAVSIPNLHR